MLTQSALGIDLQIPKSFGHWLAGFVDGEGCFYAGWKRSCGERALRFSLNIRKDDSAVLEKIISILKVGAIKSRPNRNGSNSQLVYEVRRLSDLRHVIVPLFENYPLRAKKANDFNIWKELVLMAFALKNKTWPKNHLVTTDMLTGLLRSQRQYHCCDGEWYSRLIKFSLRLFLIDPLSVSSDIDLKGLLLEMSKRDPEMVEMVLAAMQLTLARLQKMVKSHIYDAQIGQILGGIT